MIPDWLTRAMDRCQCCCLDDEDDRGNLARAIADEMPESPAVIECIAMIRRLVDAVEVGYERKLIDEAHELMRRIDA